MRIQLKKSFLFYLGLFSILFLGVRHVHAQSKIELGNKQVKITLESGRSSLSLRIKAESSFTTEVFSLNKPARIVVDAIGLKLKSHKSTSVGKTKILKGFRMAVSSEKLRFVFDLRGDEAPAYSTSQEGNEFVLKIGGENELLALKAAEVTATASPTSSPVQSPSTVDMETTEVPAGAEEAETEVEQETTMVPLTSPGIVEEEATLTPSPSPSIIAVDTASACALSEIIFDKETQGGILRLVVNQSTSFKLTRDKTLYVLNLSGCTVTGQHLLLPHYPPEGFPGIDALKASIEDENIVVRIFAERGARLNAFRNGLEIWVKTVERK